MNGPQGRIRIDVTPRTENPHVEIEISRDGETWEPLPLPEILAPLPIPMTVADVQRARDLMLATEESAPRHLTENQLVRFMMAVLDIEPQLEGYIDRQALAARLYGVPDLVAFNDDLVATLIDYAKAGNREDFDFLARSSGVPDDRGEELWLGTRRRLGLTP